MLFHTPQFVVFLLSILVLFYAVPFRYGKVILLAASYVFYMYWNAKFVLLLVLLTTVDYTCALFMNGRFAQRRRAVLIAGLSANLGFLFYFKYYNFFAASLAALLHIPAQNVLLQIVLPVGISFHTFQSMSYLVDVYHGHQKPVRSFLDYALFIAFFPQLVAGPIVRAHDFFRDLSNWKRPSFKTFHSGCFLILFGMLKKVVFADRFASVADLYYNNPVLHPGSLPAWSGTLAFTFQIFFDFSAYTDIAIGSAALFGFHFPPNFRKPYFSTSVTEFWKRWHMSLSSWLRDYLYIPLGGNRHGTLTTYRNIMLTMLLGGLWHGASWNFLIWGGYQGSLLIIERAAHRGRESKLTPATPKVTQAAKLLVTFLLISLGWVFFRALTLRDGKFVVTQMFSSGQGTWLLGPWHIGMIAFTAMLAVIDERWPLLDYLVQCRHWTRVSLITLSLLILELFAATDQARPFIYFQF